HALGVHVGAVRARRHAAERPFANDHARAFKRVTVDFGDLVFTEYFELDPVAEEVDRGLVGNAAVGERRHATNAIARLIGWYQAASDHQPVVRGFDLIQETDRLAVLVVDGDRVLVQLHAGHVVHDAAPPVVLDGLGATGHHPNRDCLAAVGAR